MIIKTISTGMLQSNCYIIGDAGEAAVIDPGADLDEIVTYLDEQKLTLKYIMLTHVHIDHILHADKLSDACGGKVAVHIDDAPLLGNSVLNGSIMFGADIAFDEPDLTVEDGDELMLGGVKLKIIHTPGHTPGSICVKTGDRLFTGDTLFRLSVGRTDLGAGNKRSLSKSLQRLMEQDDGVKVFPGHGPSTDIGFERKNNPYISRSL